MGIPKSFSTHCMYSKSSKIRLPFSSLTDHFKADKARNLVTFQESNDPFINGGDMDMDARRKANTMEEIAEAKSILKKSGNNLNYQPGKTRLQYEERKVVQ